MSRWLIKRKHFVVFFLLILCVALLVFTSAISMKHIHGLFVRGEPQDLTWHRVPFVAFHAIYWLIIFGSTIVVMSKMKVILKAFRANPVSGLFVVSAILAFGLSWVSTVWMLNNPIDPYLLDTYHITFHIEWCLYLISSLLFFALVFAIWVKVFKSRYDRAFGLVFWFFVLVSLILIFLPHFEGIRPNQEPLRYNPSVDYQELSSSIAVSAKIGLAGLGLSAIIFVYLIFGSLRTTRLRKHGDVTPSDL